MQSIYLLQPGRNWRRAMAVFSTISLMLLLITPALAHSRVEVGPYAIVVGWVNEPPIVGERNAILVEISENEVPLQDAEATLDGELLYGDRTFRVNLNPSATPGTYTAELYPTARGQYALRLFGNLGDTAVDVIVEPEEVFSASRIQFPEAQPDLRDLQNEITGLQASLETTRAFSYAGLATGLIGIVTAIFASFRRRRTEQGSRSLQNK